MATYTYNGMEFEDIPGNEWCVRLTAVREPANWARVLTVPDRVNGKGVAEIGQAGCCDAKCESVILPKNLTVIHKHAFLHCENLKSFTVPEFCMAIGEGAFSDCLSLTSFNFNKVCNRIMPHTFSGCRSLKTITLPDNAIVENFAFGSLTSLTIPSGFSGRILNNAFWRCPITTITVGGAGRIEPNAFEGCPVESITFTGSYTGGLTCGAFRKTLKRVVFKGSKVRVGKQAFKWCSQLESVEGDIAYLEDEAFSSCSKLKSLRGSLEYIGDSALSGTAITSVPTGAKHIGAGAFSCCSQIKSYNFSSFPGDEIPAGLFNGSGLESVSIGSPIKKIGRGAFNYCEHLKKVYIGGSVLDIGEYAFCGCKALTDVDFGSYYGSESKKIGNYAFMDCTSLKKVVFPFGMKEIKGEGMFADCTLDSISIPSTVEKIYLDINYRLYGIKEIRFDSYKDWVISKEYDNTYSFRYEPSVIVKPEDLYSPAKAAEIFRSNYSPKGYWYKRKS